MPETCTNAVKYKYNPKTSRCVLSDTGNDNIVITANDKIKYKNEMYVYREQREHCNNYTEKWQDWFCIKYYYLNNNYEQGVKTAEDALTDTISECLIPCKPDYIAVNSSDKCESIDTFKNKKYSGFLPYDPFAIICIIASKINETGAIDNDIPGSHLNVLTKIVTATDTNKWIWLTDSANLYEIRNGLTNTKADASTHDNLPAISSNINNYDIKPDIAKAYSDILKYIKDIRSENEEDQAKIKNNIKSDIYKFFVLFDKRDEFYISYLKHINIKDMAEYFQAIRDNLKAGTRGGRGGGGGMEYAYNLASKYTKADIDIADADADADADMKKAKAGAFADLKKSLGNDEYLMYLFYHACDMCFSSTSIFRNRLKNFLSIDAAGKDDLAFFEYETKIFSDIVVEEKDKLIYKPLIPVKIDKENITIFGEYTEALGYYKNIVNLFPVILLLVVGITVAFVILKFINFLKYVILLINIILTIVYILVLFSMKLIVNSVTIGIISYIILQPAIFIYNKTLAILSAIILSVIILHVEPSQVAAPANNKGVDYRWIFFKTFMSIIVSILNAIANVIRELLKSNVLSSIFAFVMYTIYDIILKGDSIMDIILYADASFLNIVDLKYKIYKNQKLYDLYQNYLNEHNIQES
jgi:hypothetical protein